MDSGAVRKLLHDLDDIENNIRIIEADYDGLYVMTAAGCSSLDCILVDWCRDNVGYVKNECMASLKDKRELKLKEIIREVDTIRTSSSSSQHIDVDD